MTEVKKQGNRIVIVVRAPKEQKLEARVEALEAALAKLDPTFRVPRKGEQQA